MIELINIKKEYGTGDKAQEVLKGVDLTIDQGEYVIIAGKSGSGKSTLLNIISGIDRASSGKIVINQEDIRDLNEDQLARWRGEKLGIIFQFFQLIPTLSIMENVLLPMDLVNKIPPNKRTEKAVTLLKTVDMYDHRDKRPGQLSGGEQQRVAIARALANDVNLVVADEPTGNLDTKNTKHILALLKNLNKQGQTIVMVTHEKGDIDGATRRIVLQDGLIIDDVKCNKGDLCKKQSNTF